MTKLNYRFCLMSILKSKEHLTLGARGEKAATIYLKKQGYKILETNFFNPMGRRIGEIDIIAKDQEEIVFIEVKTRSYCENALTTPEQNINKAKLYKLNKIASYYISKNRLYSSPFRFDAITIIANNKNNSAKLRHLKNIFI